MITEGYIYIYIFNYKYLVKWLLRVVQKNVEARTGKKIHHPFSA